MLNIPQLKQQQQQQQQHYQHFTKEPFSTFEKNQTEISTATDLHGLSESKIITEHRCTTEATMRLEHKSTYLDLPDLSQRTKTPAPVELDATTTNKQTVATNTQITESRTGSTQTPPIVPPKPQPTNNKSTYENYASEQTSTNEKNLTSSSFEFFKNIETKTLNEPTTGQLVLSIPTTTANETATKANESLEQELRNLNLIPGSPPEICYIPKLDSSAKTEAISEKIKKIEEHQQTVKEAPQGGISVLPQSIPRPIPKVTRSPSPKPSAEGIAMSRLWTPTSHLSGYESSNNLSDIEQSYKSETEIIKEFKTPKVCLPANNELRAPSLVKEATKSVSIPIKKETNDIQLIPGSPPEICFTPKQNVEVRRQSLVEAMEKTLEQNLLQGPSKVLPHSVPTLTPPSPTPNTYTQKPSTMYRPPPPVIPTKYNNNYYESDYESDRYKYSGSESDDTSLRHKVLNEQQQATTNGLASPLPAQQPATQQQAPSYYNQYTKTSGYAADTEDVAKNSYSYANSISSKYNQPQYTYTNSNGHNNSEYSREEQVRSIYSKYVCQ